MVKTITFPVSDELHIKFKKYCLDKNVNMKEALVLAVELIINKKTGKNK